MRKFLDMLSGALIAFILMASYGAALTYGYIASDEQTECSNDQVNETVTPAETK